MDVKQIVSQMTLEEKVVMCSGADFWHTEKTIVWESLLLW